MKPSPLLPLLLLLHATTAAISSPLSTAGRWIVDAGSGNRVKLACVNWPSHLDLMLAEGLSKRPLDDISKAIRSMGFNCVRLTWPTFLLTDASLANLTVRQSFQRAALQYVTPSLILHNPTLADLKLIEAFQAVVSNLEDNNIMVILDNHISKPGWCCSPTDGNGFFGDAYFDPNVWTEGLSKMATFFRGRKNVVAMSLRNELRGPNQNVNAWFSYMQMGAEAVHAANEDVLVILSGLHFDNDLGFLSARQVNLTFKDKLVFELHWYAFSDGNAWAKGNANDVCGMITGSATRRAGFLLARAFPLFLSEFGVDQRGGNVNDNRYFGCVLAFVAGMDLDWALWALQGSYYLREGVVDLDEVYGVLTFDWSSARNRSLLRRVQSVQRPFQGPGVAQNPPYALIFHPFSGLCVATNSVERPALVLGSCEQPWEYSERKTLSPPHSSSCLNARAAGELVRLESCDSSSSKWDLSSASQMHLTTQLTQGSENTTLCLDVDEDGRSIVASPCECLSGDASCDPERQWFKLVASGRAVE
ncbi:hypothetical protein Cni_G11167 [Canna indica]|uniref:Ricin B lectin domain-containing protein n=1 Tax=Canna indica TaxID=4628 RepID=A0AAQ3K5J4_9LILI|nr:hypothetical protein Cni_G11167 [Canna indica]